MNRDFQQPALQNLAAERGAADNASAPKAFGGVRLSSVAFISLHNASKPRLMMLSAFYL